MPMFGAFLISENITCPGAIQRRPAAFGMNTAGVPPPTGTLSDEKPALVKTMREPSGVKAGAIFCVPSRVNATAKVEHCDL